VTAAPAPTLSSAPSTATRFRVALYEGVGSRPLDPALRAEHVLAMLGKGYAVTTVRPGGSVSPSAAGTLVVLGRFDEPKAARVDGDVTVFFRDVDGLDAAAAAGLVEAVRDEVGLPQPGKWKPWFPVIDYDRCTNCMQCLSFCLFDVYGVSEDKKIQVQNQNKCKTDCPACSRVCPEVAILFPKYRHGPINGDVVNEDDLRRESMKVDISALLGGDIYLALRDRSAKAKSRFSKERDSDKALEERKKCLVALGQLDIPAEVFASLPSPDEIQQKAVAAAAKAEAALAGRS
jgi:NAD-dependent dihydropyrimidine dehydrogenase PreA subunit